MCDIEFVLELSRGGGLLKSLRELSQGSMSNLYSRNNGDLSKYTHLITTVMMSQEKGKKGYKENKPPKMIQELEHTSKDFLPPVSHRVVDTPISTALTNKRMRQDASHDI